jgi:hypothetical protein
MKKVILGFVTGVITALTFTAFATSTELFTAQQATFDIYVKGEKFVSENPPVVIEGRTYLPLRDIGEALGVSVEWNGTERKVEIGKQKQPDSAENFNKVSGLIEKDFADVTLITIDGLQYATVDLFRGYTQHEGKDIYVDFNGKSLKVREDGNPTEHSILYQDRIFVKLSSFDIKAKAVGNMLIIE